MSHNTRFITTPDDPSRVWKVRRLSDGKFKQTFSSAQSNTDADRWGHAYDRIWVVEAQAEAQADKERFPCEVVTFRLLEIKV